MPDYPLFVAGTSLLTAGVLALAVLTERQLEPSAEGVRLATGQPLSTSALYANVVVSQLLVVGLLGALVFVAAVPTDRLGIRETELAFPWVIAVGLVLGVALYVLDEVSIELLDRFDITYSEDLRTALAPDNLFGWVILLGVVLPVIASAEELLFRAAMIGGFEGALGLSPWILVVVSSVTFAVGHGLQGVGGILVTGALGLLLGAAYVLSGSLLLVIIAHYVVNALEFVLNEGLERSWVGREPID